MPYSAPLAVVAVAPRSPPVIGCVIEPIGSPGQIWNRVLGQCEWDQKDEDQVDSCYCREVSADLRFTDAVGPAVTKSGRFLAFVL